MKRIPRVALIIETSGVYGRQLIEGINQYLQEHRPWSVYLEQMDLFAEPPGWLQGWDGDGVICRTLQSRDAIRALRLPVVDLSDVDEPEPELARIESDHHAIGRMVAEHLIERDFHQFGFSGFGEHRWSRLRQEGFTQATREAGFKTSIHNATWRGKDSWHDDQQRLENWLEAFDGPTGIMTANDMRGQQVLDACANLNLAVPETMAVVGCDNDSYFCRLCRPQLSSVVPNAIGIGFEAAKLLATMMAGNLPPKETRPRKCWRKLAPLRIVTRESSDSMAINDPDVVAAMSYMRTNACYGIGMTDVMNHVDVSRATLERRFRELVGSTPHNYLRSLRLRKAKELLVETQLPLDRIAELSGFEHPEYLSVLFKRVEGVTPGTFRNTQLS